MRLAAAIRFATLAALAGTGPAIAATSTSGCASATGCTLSELYAGGSLTVDDLRFDGFVDQGTVGAFPFDFDPDEIFVSGALAGDSVSLNFAVSPAVNVFGLTDSAIDWDFTVTSITSRTILGASLSVGNVSITGGDGFGEVQSLLVDDLLNRNPSLRSAPASTHSIPASRRRLRSASQG
mgnify:CR=1 FL=1